MLFSSEIFGAWIATFLTLAIFSYLYDDNPFYKAAEHIYVGVSAGYWACLSFWTQVQPNLFGRLWPRLPEDVEMGALLKMWYGIYDFLGILNDGIFPEGGIVGHTEIRWIYLIPLALGVMMLLRLVPKVGWLARWSLAYIVGMAAGLRFYGYLNSDVIEQVKASTVDFSGSPGSIIGGLLVVFGTLAGLVYFFFSKAHTGAIGKISKLGIYFLMISFGASFGFTVMGRISLLIGRLEMLMDYSHVEYLYSTWWILGLMIVLLAVWAFSGRGKKGELSA